MNGTSDNHVRTAVDTLGGVTITSNLLGVSNGCVHNWIKQRRVTNIYLARKLADLAGLPVENVRPV